MKIGDTIWKWLDSRSHISDIPLRGMPEYALNVTYWTGAFLGAAFVYLVATGMFLLFYYRPGETTAYASTQYIMTQVPYGNLIFTSHQYMAYAMIFVVFVHFFRNYYLGIYKKPREVSWIIGILMSIVVITMGFTGYFLPYTEISVDATNVGIGLAKFIPTIGPLLASITFGNGTVASEFSRLLALHIVILPAILFILFGLHMYLFEQHEIAPPPGVEENAGKRSIPWFPVYLAYSAAVSFLLWGAVLIWSALKPLHLGPPASSAIPVVPLPEWYLAAYYKVVDFNPISKNIDYMLMGLIIFLLAVPFLDRNKSRAMRDRPFFIAIGTTNLIYLIIYTAWAYLQPGVAVAPIIWAPIMFGILGINLLIAYVFHFRYKKIGRSEEVPPV
ncbi:cytochrome bc complex cytochrome b subunit [archaeon]|nr:cytochrome bc complex cytochrome b subunit [archaeon]